jgi:LmbE family N-acetylglucosaminyl deacetylase
MSDQTQPGVWETPQKILVILAHPDDPEFFCGGTLARWARAGHTIIYTLLTCGDKGSNDPNLDPDELCRLRHVEQRNAADVIGAQEVHFLSEPDGYLVPDLRLRKEITRIIRQIKPDVLVTCDPQTLFPPGSYRLNHPDHRAAGQVVLDAAFPAAGNPLFFPELLKDEGLEPHTPKEIWVSLTAAPNVAMDVTDLWDVKLQAIKQHASQIGDAAQLEERLRARHTEDSTREHPRYEEKFHLINWR